jgi:PAS domain S-box-containing protein
MPQTREAVRQYQQTGRIEPYEKEYFRKSGERFWGLFGGRRIESSGEGVAFVLDITARKRAEAALRASEEQHRADLQREVQERTAELQQNRDLLQATMDSSMDMIQVFEAVRDEHGEIVDFRWVLNNHTSERWYGEVPGESLLERNPGVVQEGIFDTFKRVLETGEPVVAERHYVHEQFNGWFFQSAVKLGDGVATTTREITAWKQAQEEVLRLQDEVAQTKLRESEQNLHGVANIVPDLLWYSEPDGWTPWYNNRWLEYTGQTFEQAIGWGWVDAIHPDDRAGSARRYREAVEQNKLLQQEHRIRRHDGEYRWFLVRAEPQWDGQDRVTRMYGAATDIHDQRMALEALRQSEERLQLALDTARLATWDWDIATDKVAWSDEHFRLQGHAVGEVPPSYEGWVARIHPEDRADAEAELMRARDERREYVHVFRSLHPDGKVVWLCARGRFFYDAAGKPTRMIGVMEDVTASRSGSVT